MVGEPGLDGGNLTIRQQRHDPPPLQITDDRAVTMAATEGPIINADNFERICLQTGPSPHHPQQRVITDRDHQPLRKTGRRPAAERQPKMMNDTLQSRGPAGSLGGNAVVKAFSEDSSTTQWRIADKAAGNEVKLYLHPGTGKIRNSSKIAAMDPVRHSAAKRARSRWRP
ncbi:hypothetical protein X743_30015 [Mesorhizobium sp. LNHC252B00]|nr:hypothetical protein X743_30015 [Mesorhizobium sp. LNHC252B00]